MTAGRIQPAQERSWRNGWGLLKFRYLSIILVLGLVAGLAYRMNSTPEVPGQATERGGRRGGGGAGGAGIPIPVSAFEVKNADVRIKLNKLLGTVTPLANVTIKTQINGRLMSVDFAEGQQVKRGDLLAQIDPRPFQYALEQAEGQLARDKATLRNAELDLKRYRTLVAQDSIATQQLDGQEALVRQLTGTVAGDQAQVDTAKLNLSFCRIVAPIDGRTGLRLVDPGNYVQVGDNTGIVVITQIKPICRPWPSAWRKVRS
jgi:multidrug efflux system membrane fusion protein